MKPKTLYQKWPKSMLPSAAFIFSHYKIWARFELFLAPLRSQKP